MNAKRRKMLMLKAAQKAYESHYHHAMSLSDVEKELRAGDAPAFVVSAILPWMIEPVEVPYWRKRLRRSAQLQASSLSLIV